MAVKIGVSAGKAMGFFRKLGVPKLIRTAQTKVGQAWRQGRHIPRKANFPVKKLQKKYKHAHKFGVTDNWYKGAGEKFKKALQDHLGSPGTAARRGTYHGDPCRHFYNPKTGLNIVVDANGNFVSGWKLSPEQTRHLFKTGDIGGG